jgi:phosphate:Na+ symporter
MAVGTSGSEVSPFDISIVSYIGFFIGIVLIYMKKHRYIGDFLFGIGLLLLGLTTLKATGMSMDLANNETITSFFKSFDPNSFWTTLVFLLLGGIMTFCVQSSAAVMAITMLLCSTGAMPIYQGIALVLGENIGTTVTSNLAALSANTQARRAALAHMFFNVFGVVFFLIIFYPACNAVSWFVDNVMGGGNDLFKLSAFHTAFNIINTLLLIGFVGRRWMRLDYFTLMGLIAGSTTDPPALAYATSQSANNDRAAVAYSTVYPLTMFLRVLTGQLMILLFI